MSITTLLVTITYPPTSRHFWVDDFPAFPFGGILCDPSLEGIHKPCFLLRLHSCSRNPRGTCLLKPPAANKKNIQTSTGANRQSCLNQQQYLCFPKNKIRFLGTITYPYQLAKNTVEAMISQNFPQVRFSSDRFCGGCPRNYPPKTNMTSWKITILKRIYVSSSMVGFVQPVMLLFRGFFYACLGLFVFTLFLLIFVFFFLFILNRRNQKNPEISWIMTGRQPPRENGTPQK